MILVTGATGTTGSEVVRQLIERGERVRAMSRGRVEIPGAETVRGDFGDAPSLARAVEGVAAVYLVTMPPKPTIDHDAALIEAAGKAGVERIVKLSAISAEDPDAWHSRAERPTRESGLDWTVLRPPSFASNMLHYTSMIRSGAPLPNWTGTGASGVIDPRDIAAVAVEALLADGHGGRTYTPTGPELLTFGQQVAVLQRATGTAITTEEVSIERARAMMLDDGADPDNVEESLKGIARQAEGGYATLTDHVPKILGRAARSFTDWANDHREAFL
jgi:uncharacterized protein YbjT (DUF2867 family)